MKYIVTLQREIRQRQEVKVVIDVPASDESGEITDPRIYAEDKACELVESKPTDDEFEDEHGVVTRPPTPKSGTEVKWKNIEATDQDSMFPTIDIIAVRKFKPSTTKTTTKSK